ncbi:MAG: recombinase family protein [Spirulinaceae cyanobacterium]
MKIFAYIYSDPLLEPSPEPEIWGLEIDRVYQDLGERQQLEQMFLDCEDESPEYLLIRRLEELGTSLEEVSDRLTKLAKMDIEVIATEQPYSSVEGEQQGNLWQLAAEITKNQNCHRLRQGHARNRLKALPPPGKAPYGYRRGKDRYIIDRSTAPVVKEFFERFLIYGSLRGAVRYLENKYGKKISVTTGKRWLTNPVYRGDLAYKSGEVITNTHIAIISSEEAAQIDRLLRRNSFLATRTASAPRSLAGLVVCQQCTSAMTITQVTTRNKKYNYLYLRPISCPQKPKCKAIAYQKVLQQTIELICQELPLAVAQMKGPNLEGIKQSLQGDIATKEEIILQLPTLQEQGIFDEETVALRRYKLNQEIAQIKAKLAQLPPVNLQAIAQAVSLPQFWLDLSEAERRFYFREFLQKIEIIRTEEQNWQLKLGFIF